MPRRGSGLDPDAHRCQGHDGQPETDEDSTDHGFLQRLGWPSSVELPSPETQSGALPLDYGHRGLAEIRTRIRLLAKQVPYQLATNPCVGDTGFEPVTFGMLARCSTNRARRHRFYCAAKRGIEPRTSVLTGRHSSHLSYLAMNLCRAAGKARTSDSLLKRQVL